LISAGAVSNAGAKQALDASFASGEPVEAAIDRLGLRQVSDTGALGALADEVLAENPDVVQKFRDGKEGVIGFLVGQLMQKAAGAANPKVAQELLRERLQG
jgi:aspartyl-tRNA(Asn)/glutamyl-tRNA(Gln) amidotransferase subunit B